MFNSIHQNFMRPALIAYSLLAGCLTLVSIPPIQVVAQIPASSTAQAEYDWNSQYSQNSESYLVIVDNSDPRILQQVRLVEPTAFTGTFEGRSVIQAGVFSRLNNAQERIRQLQAYGIGSRIYSQSTGREVANSNNGSSPRDNSTRQRTKYYYVAIPEKSDKLFEIENQIRQSAGGNSVGIIVRNSPRGPHVAVGPFAGRLQAEQWNYYIRSLGLNDARVYYGK
ncbi:MAG: hypothetical protein HC836_18525 [Richelia sp. RM2_1_2]|nr:hypothetical protein [Richelia sp. RM1_1_1]NJO60188.1 hypothetical protein [Richelia sp. RM2_1_2]